MTEPLADSHDRDLELLEQALKYRDGELTAEEIARLAARIQLDPAAREEFIQTQLQATLLHEIVRWEFYSDPELKIDKSGPHSKQTGRDASPGRGRRWGAVGLSTAVLLLAVIIIVPWTTFLQPPAEDSSSSSSLVTSPASGSDVLLTESVHVNFFERATPALGSALQQQEDYFLQKGLVKLSFPDGATAIIEGPAMFRVVNEKCLSLGAGSCSVHAPPGAEGFRVETPRGSVIDRGTRFAVTVSEVDETEIHVIEGQADLFPLSDPVEKSEPTAPVTPSASEKGIALHTHQAGRLVTRNRLTEVPIPFDPQVYRHQLPDRIVRYEATKNQDGYAEELLSVSVQRGGRFYRYQADELIPVEVTWFHGDAQVDRTGHLADGPQRPARPSDWLEDRKLSTGFMNIGGQVQPLERDPVMKLTSRNGDPDEATGTPGLGIRFRRPIVNQAGPDVVLFELQSFMQSWEGDPFHVSPVHFRPGLKTVTIRQFDLTMHSQESLKVPAFWRHRYLQPVRSLLDLATQPSEIDPGPLHVRFRATAVGIDLSDLGYSEGEQVDELFIQHAIPEEQYIISQPVSKVDPVFIAGLPPIHHTP